MENSENKVVEYEIITTKKYRQVVKVQFDEKYSDKLDETKITPRDIDFGMIMGTGWAPFRGGPMRYLDSEGALNVFNRMKKLEKKSKYFKPCEMLLEYSNTDEKFYGGK